MSRENLANETFGDISLFVSFRRGNSSSLEMDVLTIAPQTISSSSSQAHDDNKSSSFDEYLTVSKNKYDASNETSFENDNKELLHNKKLETGENQVEDSETENKFESWSGLEISSESDSWGSSEKCNSLNEEAGQMVDMSLNDNDGFLPAVGSCKRCENVSDNVSNIKDEPTSTVSLDAKDEQWFDIDLNDESSFSENRLVDESDASNDEIIDGDDNTSKKTDLNYDFEREVEISDEHLSIEDEGSHGINLNEKPDEDVSFNSNNSYNPEVSKQLDDSIVLPDNDSCNENESIKGLWSDIDLEDEDDNEPIKRDQSDTISTNNSERQDACSKMSEDNVMVVEMDLNDDRSIGIREEEDKKGWTILEVWCSFAMITGAIPYWISNDGQTTKIKRSIVTNVLWTCSVVLYVSEILNVLPKISSVLTGEQDGSAYLNLSNHISFALFRFSFTFIAIFRSKYLTKANDLLISFSSLKMSTMKMIICLLLLISFAISNTLLYVWFQTELKIGFKDVTILKMLQRLECFGKIHLKMTRSCAPSSNTITESLLFGAIGVITTTHEIFSETIICLGILTLCATLLLTTHAIEETEVRDPENEFAHVTSNDLTVITNMADNLSHFIGEALLGYLLYNATETAKMTLLIFPARTSVFMSLLLRNGVVFIGLIMGSFATARINRISDAISSQTNADPQNGRPGTAILLAYMHDMIFRKSIGIGVVGMFVITYKITFSVRNTSNQMRQDSLE